MRSSSRVLRTSMQYYCQPSLATHPAISSYLTYLPTYPVDRRERENERMRGKRGHGQDRVNPSTEYPIDMNITTLVG